MIIIILCSIILFSCKGNKSDQVNIDKELNRISLTDDYIPALDFQETRYVSAYSNLYYRSAKTNVYCTVVLSIRNTSLTESIYVDKVDYYDSFGELISSYVQETNKLRPLETREFLVEYNDQEGGSGANFIVNYGASNELKDFPIIEAVSIGHVGNNGFAITSPSQIISSNPKS
ncbi:DUF3124 domain-containing protein [Flammeovirga aprica]|uniref:DUF3124 domain-containing protein n=1 Tax=Flammeovirga aprica JL-4 TaxID=694437 RepID=A0A7X9XCY5_9BACT|nr:DUF3124 domain-containing protein [Flammeovirga aprica]NME72326.1 DUF3124 domain-containing protein [Flammeovirga aprica JL-4]